MMNHGSRLSRRNFLNAASMTGLALLLVDCTSRPTGILAVPLQPSADSAVEIDLAAVVGEQGIFDGPKTKVWQYEGKVVRGDANMIQQISGSYLGPVIRVKTGQRVRVNFTNRVTEPSIVHWHGLHLPQEMDGHPMYAIQPGETYHYEFQVLDRAGTYWFHPHPEPLTGAQVYRGLAGLFIVSDDEESQAGLPAGAFDVPLVIQDRVFDGDNQFVYLSDGMMAPMTGALGDTILVNGRPDFMLPAAASVYRLRLLNGSNARTYKLAWDDGTPLTVIGTDGGLLESAVQRPYIMLSPGERIELWVDFSEKAVGSQLHLVSLAFSDGGMMGMMGGNSLLANGDPFPVMTVQIDQVGTGQKFTLPQKLSTILRYQEQDAANRRTFALGMGGMGGMMGGMGMGWTINGRTFEMEKVAQDEIVKRNTLELWVYDNQGNGGGMMGGMMQMLHPMHIHGLQFQVLGWEVDPNYQSAWDSVREGLITEGWKDTVMVMPGTRVKLLMKFQDFTGLFLHHCHILEHEDAGMMRNYRIDA